MGLPPEKISELKQLIHNHLNQLDIHGQIRSVVSESLHKDSTADQDEKNLLRILKEQGVVEDVMKTLKFHGALNNFTEATKNKKNEEDWIPEEHRKCE